MSNKVISISKVNKDNTLQKLEHKEVLIMILEDYKSLKKLEKEMEEVIEVLKVEVDELFKAKEQYLFIVNEIN